MELTTLTDEQLKKYIERCIANYTTRIESMEIGENYYKYSQEIDDKKRIMIGNKRIIEMRNMPNQKLKDNQYARAVDQKINYLLAEKPNLDSKDSATLKYLTEFFDNRFMRTLNALGTNSYNCGIAWLYLSTDGEEINYKKLDSKVIIPIWVDDNHDSLEGIIYLVSKEEFEGSEIVKKSYVYLYTKKEVKIFAYDNGNLTPVDQEAYLEKNNVQYDYGRIPFVYFKQPGEMPLINRVKSLQDALNLILSNYADGMLQNPGNTILILKNYDGQDLEEFRKNLAEVGAVKVRSTPGAEGGIDSLEININSENYKVIIEMLKKAIAHNARSLYLDNDRTSNAPNTLNIKAMYSDMELDANAMELEFTASFEYLFKFINQVNGIDFKDANISFKRNIMVNDESTVEMIKNSVGIVSDKTLRANHPLVEDTELEEQRIKEQEENKLNMLDDYSGLGDSHEEE